MPQENHNRVRSLWGRGVLTEARRRRGSRLGARSKLELALFFFFRLERLSPSYTLRPWLTPRVGCKNLWPRNLFPTNVLCVKIALPCPTTKVRNTFMSGQGTCSQSPPPLPASRRGVLVRLLVGGGPGPRRQRFSRWPQPSRSGSNRTAPSHRAPRGPSTPRQCCREVGRPRDSGRPHGVISRRIYIYIFIHILYRV